VVGGTPRGTPLSHLVPLRPTLSLQFPLRFLAITAPLPTPPFGAPQAYQEKEKGKKI